MARRKAGPILAEILAALDGIEKATSGKTLHDYEQDWLLKHGVQRGIEIISEAARHLPAELLVTEPEIPWKQIRGIGNVLRHEYHRIADPIVWAVVTDSLPTLRKAIERIATEVAKRES
ncbi:HepT-like ribonuclease domain-containing protein [Aminobacter sp. Piv2-1]|uniref:HepT-like ribonuclease domain-containing protein n=1 Tax=Aminobacter sp. Piv2-1 TaxID=3031122 RepID=UPI0030A80261